MKIMFRLIVRKYQHQKKDFHGVLVTEFKLVIGQNAQFVDIEMAERD
jgi:hypothetical protein